MKKIQDHYTLLKVAVFMLATIALSLSSPSAAAAQSREIRVANTAAIAGEPVDVPIEMTALGDENKVSFSLSFDPAILTAPVATFGLNATGVKIDLNLDQAAKGRLEITLTCPAGQTLTAGTHRLLSLHFTVAAEAQTGSTAITLNGDPEVFQVLDVNANKLSASQFPGQVSIPFSNAKPILTTLSPSAVAAGSGALTLLVRGADFVTESIVFWNGRPRLTTYVSSSRLKALIPAADLAVPGTATIGVVSPKSGSSNILNFSIVSAGPAATLTSLIPNFALLGGEAFTLTVNGSDFAANSTVLLNGSSRATTFVSATQLQAAITAEDLAALGTAQITVLTPGGGTTSALPLSIVNRVSSVSAASFNGPPIARESIVAAFGIDLCERTQSAASLPLPTNLVGTQVTVKDSLGVERSAPLFYASPGQVNYVIPQDAAAGDAMVTVTRAGELISAGPIKIIETAPGLFTANANGQGVAAAVILRVKSDGSQVYEPAVGFDSATNQFVAVPIEVASESDQVYLILYGTGIRFRSSLSAVTALIGGLEATVLYADLAPGFVGLDQCNILLPSGLAGRGEVSLELTVDGTRANPVSLNFK